MNKFIGIGRLTRDVELKYTQSGKAYARFTIAIDRPFSQNGEKQADFLDIVTWGKQAENCANFIGKGRLVAIEGRVQVRSWEDSEGKRRKAWEIVADRVQFLDKAKGQSGSQGNAEDFATEVNFDSNDVPF